MAGWPPTSSRRTRSAEINFRIVGPAAAVRVALESLTTLVQVEDVVHVPPVEMVTVPGFDTAVFPFTTDIPFLAAWGEPLLFGPGSVLVAHTAKEHVRIDDLRAAIGHYVRIVTTLLKRVEAGD